MPSWLPPGVSCAGEAGKAPKSTLLLGDHLDAHPHVGVDLEHQDLGRVDTEVADVEGLFPLDDERALVGGRDRYFALDRPGHAVEREVTADAVPAVVLLDFDGLPFDRGETPGVDAAHHL